jgi:D-alanyl-lipoteichoic acid acyltransferase DltB (MBOAT superfamily)
MNTIHRTPIAASSLRDFWGRRWYRMVSGWLNAFIFLPLARRHRPGLGLTCAFLASAAMHAWLVIGVGTFAVVSMAIFFGLQSLFIWAEDRLCVKTWPAPLARAWTLIVLLGLSPLIVVPILGSFRL